MNLKIEQGQLDIENLKRARETLTRRASAEGEPLVMQPQAGMLPPCKWELFIQTPCETRPFDEPSPPKCPRWASPLGEIECDDFTVSVFKPRRRCWLIPDYWRFRLSGLADCWRFRLFDLQTMRMAIDNSEGFVSPGALIANEMPEAIMWSDDEGVTWESSGEYCGDNEVTMIDRDHDRMVAVVRKE